MKDGRRFGRPPDPHSPPETPAGTINTTDHDSRIVRTAGQPAKQGYNAQAAVNERQIVIAAEITVDSPDFGHFEPMVDATVRELEQVGVTEFPEVVVADPGYWHKRQMENVVSRRIAVLIRPIPGCAKTPGRDGTRACMRSCAVCLPPSTAGRSTEHARPRSSRCSARSSSTAALTGSNDAEDRPCARSGDWRQRPTTCSSSTTTDWSPQGPETAPKHGPSPIPKALHPNPGPDGHEPARAITRQPP
jgi:hypothetical protein